MPTDWKLLLAFEAVARHGSFSRAAQQLNVQQPAMSRRVAALETLLGTRLLHRTRPVLSLTESSATVSYHLVWSPRMESEERWASTSMNSHCCGASHATRVFFGSLSHDFSVSGTVKAVVELSKATGLLYTRWMPLFCAQEAQ